MTVRAIIRRKRRVLRDTGWRSAALAPSDAPFFAKPRTFPAGWRWRSLALDGRSGPDVLVVVCCPSRSKWQAVLARRVEGGYAVLARLEDHGSHPGLHVHAACDADAFVVGAAGMNGLVRIPAARAPHRRRAAWSEKSFLAAAMRVFRIEPDGS